MDIQSLEIKASIQIAKPSHEVFEAITDGEKMSNYFIEKSTGNMEEGVTVTWKWPEFAEEAAIRVDQILKDQYISFYWPGENDTELYVEITLNTLGDSQTVVSVTEKGMHADEAGLRWMKGNTEGWANFLACLKAWLEYGINLRKGAFDFRAKQA